jgi:hypothetical protein
MTRIGIALPLAAACLALIAATAAAQQPATPRQTEAMCLELYQPVCGTSRKDRVTYANSCFAKLDRATHITEGPCGPVK